MSKKFNLFISRREANKGKKRLTYFECFKVLNLENYANPRKKYLFSF